MTTVNQLRYCILDTLHKHRGRQFTVRELAEEMNIDSQQELSRIGNQLDMLWKWDEISCSGLQRKWRKYWIEK